jgi:hypothetical protein
LPIVLYCIVYLHLPINLINGTTAQLFLDGG